MRATTARLETFAGYAAARRETRHEGWARVAYNTRNVLLFAAAPFIGLAYAMAAPFVGLGALLWFAVRAARERNAK